MAPWNIWNVLKHVETPHQSYSVWFMCFKYHFSNDIEKPTTGFGTVVTFCSIGSLRLNTIEYVWHVHGFHWISMPPARAAPNSPLLGTRRTWGQKCRNAKTKSPRISHIIWSIMNTSVTYVTVTQPSAPCFPNAGLGSNMNPLRSKTSCRLTSLISRNGAPGRSPAAPHGYLVLDQRFQRRSGLELRAPKWVLARGSGAAAHHPPGKTMQNADDILFDQHFWKSQWSPYQLPLWLERPSMVKVMPFAYKKSP